MTGHSFATVERRYGARAPHAKHRHEVIIERFGMARLIEAIKTVNYPTVDLQGVLASDNSIRRTSGISPVRSRGPVSR